MKVMKKIANAAKTVKGTAQTAGNIVKDFCAPIYDGPDREKFFSKAHAVRLIDNYTPIIREDGKTRVSGKKAAKLAKDFWCGVPHGERRLGELYIGDTGIYRHREWRGVVDTNYYFTVWLRLLGLISRTLAQGNIYFLKGLWRYRWMETYLSGISWVDRGNEGMRGPALRASALHFIAMFDDSVRQLNAQFLADANLHGGKRNERWYKTLQHDETVPGHIAYGFPELKDDICVQLTTCFLQNHVNQQTIPWYIDAVESVGLAPDACSLCAAEAGICVRDDYPDFSPCFVANNMACDGSVGTSILQELYFNKPFHSFPAPMRHDEEELHQYTIDEFLECIEFMEKQLGMKWDWDTFYERIERFNDQTRFELEKWDVAAKTPYSPVSSVAQALYRIFYFYVGDRPIFHKTDRKVKRIMERCVRKKIETFPKTRHRALVWSCAPLYYSYITTWLYNCWGINVVINMDSLMGHNIIDTSDRDQCLLDFAKMYEKGAMRTHAVGGYEHFLEVFDTMEQFDCDMVIMFDQVACKGAQELHGVFEDEYRKRDIHAIWVPHELLDHRTVERAEMRKIVNDYMFTVMNEEPLDPSLLDIDDSRGW